jgi:DNA-binding MarR family transcriptional regulator
MKIKITQLIIKAIIAIKKNQDSKLGISPSRLARQIDVTQSAFSIRMHDLIRLDLIKKVPINKRQTTLNLTTQGEKVYHALMILQESGLE